MKIPTQLILGFLQALTEGAQRLDNHTQQGTIRTSSFRDLISLLLSHHPEKDVARFYEDAILNKMER